MTTLLKFGRGNAKLGNEIFTFSLPAGHTCPGARDCLARVSKDGKLTDGKETLFRCFAASQEAMYGSVRANRWNNLDTLRGLDTATMRDLILASLRSDARLVRVHVSGDFFSQGYFLAWMQVAALRPDTVFYAYTKSVNLWVLNRSQVPSNFKLTASFGGRWDHLIKEYGLKSATVVFSVEQAAKLGLAIDHDDSLAYGQEKSFALLLHGTQPKGSVAAKSLSALKKLGHKGYSRKNRSHAKQSQSIAIAA